MNQFQIVSVNISNKTGERKVPVDMLYLRENHGAEGDAHAGTWHRQVSLLAEEDIDIMRAKGVKLANGDFAENITIRGIDLASLPVGTKLRIDEVLLEVTQIGKKCHRGCAIMDQVGDCIMPRQGIFAKVLKGGTITRESTGSYD